MSPCRQQITQPPVKEWPRFQAASEMQPGVKGLWDHCSENAQVGSAVVVHVAQQHLVWVEAWAGLEAVQAARRGVAGHQPVALQLLQATWLGAAVCDQNLYSLSVRVLQPALALCTSNNNPFFFLLYLSLCLLFLLCFQLLLFMVDLPQQIVNEDGAPQVDLRVF